MEEDSDNNSKQFINKRKFARISLIDPIRLITSEYTFEEYMGNISKTGCMLLALKEKSIGDQIKVSIKDPGGKYIEFDCLVRRCIEKDQQDLDLESREIKDILLVDDDTDLNEVLTTSLQENFNVESCFDAESAKKLIENYHFKCVLTDARMPGEDGASLLEHISKYHPECRRFMITGQADN